MKPNTDFDLFQVPEDHEDLREAVRAVAENKIAPYAAEVDRTASFPQEAYDALVASDFHAPHVPEEYGGVGADAVASAIVVEEVARVCASSSLIPGANKLGSTPLLLAGSEDLKQKYLRPLAEGVTTFSYALSEREAGSDTASMRTRAMADGDDWVLNGQKSWITNAGFSEYYTVLAVTDPDGKRGSNVSAFVVEKSDAGFSFGEKEKKMGIKGSPTRELYFDNVRIPGDRMIGEPGEGLKIALRTLDHTRVTVGAQAVGIAQGALDFALDYVKERKQFGKRIADFQGIQFMLADMAMTLGGRAPDGLRRGREVRTLRQGPLVLQRGSEVLRLRRGHAGHDRRRSAARRLRLHRGLPRRADDARRQDHPDLRGHQPDPAPGHGQARAGFLTEARTTT